MFGFQCDQFEVSAVDALVSELRNEMAELRASCLQAEELKPQIESIISISVWPLMQNILQQTNANVNAIMDARLGDFEAHMEESANKIQNSKIMMASQAAHMAAIKSELTAANAPKSKKRG